MATLVCDLDGVVYLGDRGVPGAGQALASIVDAGHRLVFVTNNSTKTPRMVIAQVAARTGFTGSVSGVVTSAMAAAGVLTADDDPVLVLGSAALSDAVRQTGRETVADWRSANSVVVGLDLELSYDRLSAAVLAVRGGARFIATNDDRTFPSPVGQQPGAGAIVAAVEAATGIAPLVCGKPHPPTVDLVRALVGEGDAVVVGDRPETDLAMGTREGWATALVLTGVTDDAAHVPAEVTPDVVLASIAALPEWLQTR